MFELKDPKDIPQLCKIFAYMQIITFCIKNCD